MNVNSASFKGKCQFLVTPRYEMFQALSFTANKVLKREDTYLAIEFEKTFSDLSKAQVAGLQFSYIIASLFPSEKARINADEMIRFLNKVDNRTFTKLILKGLLHDEFISDQIVDGKLDLKSGINKISKVKREWLAYIDLYPLRSQSPLVQYLEWLLQEKEGAQIELIQIFERWWEKVFSKYWEGKRSAYESSMQKFRKEFAALNFEEFSERAMLKIRLGESDKSIEALRGGYEINCKKIDSVFFMPSAFNVERIWSALERDQEPVTVYFPYLDLDLVAAIGDLSAQSDLDPSLMCKAIGDPTRLAMLVLLAKKPCQAVQLSQELELTRATVSHHVKLLREAGVLEVVDDSRSLQVNWNNLSKLSEGLIHFLQR